MFVFIPQVSSGCQVLVIVSFETAYNFFQDVFWRHAPTLHTLSLYVCLSEKFFYMAWPVRLSGLDSGDPRPRTQ